MSKIYMQAISDLSKLNPNKFSAIEILALDRLENKVSEMISYLESNLVKSKDLDKLEGVKKYFRLLQACCEMLSSSNLLKPVQGHVIQRDRKLINKYLDQALEIFIKYGIK